MKFPSDSALFTRFDRDLTINAVRYLHENMRKRGNQYHASSCAVTLVKIISLGMQVNSGLF